MNFTAVQTTPTNIDIHELPSFARCWSVGGDQIKSYTMNGNTLSVVYENGRYELWNVENRSRLQ